MWGFKKRRRNGWRVLGGSWKSILKGVTHWGEARREEDNVDSSGTLTNRGWHEGGRTYSVGRNDNADEKRNERGEAKRSGEGKSTERELV